jgi:hypothetical protein
MHFLEKFRQNLGSKNLEKKALESKRTMKLCMIKDAKHVGIIFDATYTVNFEIIKDFVKELTNQKKEVDVIGYVHSKKLIDHYLYRKGFEFFTQNDLNYTFEPKTSRIEAFIQKPFDLLINLSLDDYFPIRYIVKLSQASFKVGCLLEGVDNLDLMIDLEKEKQLMSDIRKEVTTEKQKTAGKKTEEISEEKKELEEEIDQKADYEIHLRFLIDQVVHYLSILTPGK